LEAEVRNHIKIE
jgi:hypothetical protein